MDCAQQRFIYITAFSLFEIRMKSTNRLDYLKDTLKKIKENDKKIEVVNGEKISEYLR